MQNYFFPLDSMCLPHYFGCACIMPSKYFLNKPTDIQNKFEEHLLITTNKGTKETDCCLELILTQEEIAQLFEIKTGFYLFQRPLPITRIKAIYFTDKYLKEQTITNITMSTAFVPERMVKLIGKFADQKTPSFAEVSKIPPSVECNEKIKSFDSLLGGFALLRLGGEDYMNYSENYFSTLAIFNTVIQYELIQSKKSFRNLFRDESYVKLKPYLKKNINETDLYELAKIEKQSIPSNSIGSIDIDKLDQSTYILAILNNYGVGPIRKTKNIDDLVLTNFKNGIKSDKSELVSLCYGINRGYSVFTNKYKHNNKEKIVKFELNTLLDYYTIESLYQFCIYDKVSNEFPYLDKLIPKPPDKEISDKINYRIIDVIVRGKKKQKKPLLEIFSEKFQTIFQEYFGIKSWENTFKQFKKEDLGKFVNEINEEVLDELKYQIEEDLYLKHQKEIDKIKSDFEDEKCKLFLLIRNCDETLFDEIDKNKNGILEVKEVRQFVNKLIQAKNIYSSQSKMNLEKIKKDEEDSLVYEKNNKQDTLVQDSSPGIAVSGGFSEIDNSEMNENNSIESQNNDNNGTNRIDSKMANDANENIFVIENSEKIEYNSIEVEKNDVKESDNLDSKKNKDTIENSVKNGLQNIIIPNPTYNESNSNDNNGLANKVENEIVKEIVKELVKQHSDESSHLQTENQITGSRKLYDYIKLGLDSALNLISSQYSLKFQEKGIKYDDSKSIGENLIILHSIPIDENKKTELAEIFTFYCQKPKTALQYIAKEKKIPFNDDHAELVLKILNIGKENKINNEDYTGKDQILF